MHSEVMMSIYFIVIVVLALGGSAFLLHLKLGRCPQCGLYRSSPNHAYYHELFLLLKKSEELAARTCRDIDEYIHSRQVAP